MPTPVPAAQRRATLAASLALALSLPGSAAAESRTWPWFHDVQNTSIGTWPIAAPRSETARNTGIRRRATPNQVVPQRPATTLPVTSCADDGSTGTLRNVVAEAASGDVIDLSELTCATITLESGAILTTLTDLSLIGPGVGALTIDGNDADSVVAHLGTGTLGISGLTLSHGSYFAIDGFPAGGCVYSTGNVELTDSAVSDCLVQGVGSTLAPGAVGGGVYAYGDLTMRDSTISGSTAKAVIGTARGGAAYFRGDLSMERSAMLGNLATGASPYYANGECGAFLSRHNVTIRSSTLSGNSATPYGLYGAMCMFRQYYTYPTGIVENSTISGNSATRGAALISSVELTVTNSTIAFNSTTFDANEFSPAGLRQSGFRIDGTAIPLNLQSTIIAHNFNQFGQCDFRAPAQNLSGSNNLIMVATDDIVPPGTISDDPLLAPLASNGGATQTHALLDGSPAIDTGNNSALLDFDQRGGGYPRVVGVGTDIGAFEVQPPVLDRIFADGFD